MEIIQVKVSELKPAEYNPRRLTKEQHAQLTESIKKFGLVDPIIANKHAGRENNIVGGHMRWRIAGEMKMETVPVFYVDLDEEQEKELNIRLNKNLGEFDFDMLANGFSEAMLKDVGFTDAEFGFNMGGSEKDDEVPEVPVEPISKLGDLYELGEHRVLCGDSTQPEAVLKLMDGKKADMGLTDPPYGGNYGVNNKSLRAQKGDKAFHWSKTRENSQIVGDDKSAQELAELLWRPSFKNLYENSNDDCSFYMTMCQGGDQMMMMMMMMMSEHWQIKHELIWVKSSPVFSMGRLDYDYQHEPILYGWKKKHNWYGQGKFLKSIWEIPKPIKS